KTSGPGGQPASRKDPGQQRTFPASAADLFASHDVGGESPDLLNDLFQRSARLQQACARHRSLGLVTGIFTHDPSRVAYCFLPKVGCTFWIRVFSFLHNFTGDAVSSPWDIPRLKVHGTRHSHGLPWGAVRDKAMHFLRFMFVRHPFSRLWSAYVDKLFLPDFWQEVGVPAVHRVRGQNATPAARKCGHDVTFPEFVQFSLTAHEPHWEPIYLRCDPCQFQPALVGSMKTFTQDSLFMLRRMGMDWVLRDVDYHAQKEKELTTLVHYNFERVRSKKFYTSCVNSTTLTRRLWKAFQVNGYIPDTAPVPKPSSGALSVREFQDQVLRAFRAASPNSKELKLQKQDYLRKALTSLSPELMAKVKAKYAPDMAYFGFDDTNY
ncbi:carbohydrate sulfotransferase 11-like, partial [Babylonia areolata]|uniref:carbohydrate sulfotransferase 11-like n=1 Tax=Babylonia areolata TaxID=304850 RepID=UPI003FD08995